MSCPCSGCVEKRRDLDLERRLRALEAENATLRETLRRQDAELSNSDAIRGAMVESASAAAETARNALQRLELAEPVASAAAYYLHRLKLAGKDADIRKTIHPPSFTAEGAALRQLAAAVENYEKGKAS